MPAPADAYGSASEPRWWERAHGEPGFLVAYFSPEFAVDSSLPVYAGGLGVLAGDHLKAAGDLGVPLVGVGLLYRQGYFRQTIAQGRQRERYPKLDPEQLGLDLERGEDGAPLGVVVELAGEEVLVQAWRRDVRGATLYLLDTYGDGSSAKARAITDVLYGGDREHRIRQELILGVGGGRVLRALGLEPSVYHLNEGHAAFLVFERARSLVEEHGLSFGDALDVVRRSTVFTTHTPVPAGNERFERDLAATYLAPLAEGVGVPVETLLELGEAPGDSTFGLTPLALRTASFANGVSELHGSVSREMWRPLWSDLDRDDVPIRHVTNAVHAPTWVSPELGELLAQREVRLDAAPDEQKWGNARRLDPSELWRVHSERKRRLLELVAASSTHLGGEALDPDALTIGFARRFATYKRAALVLSDPRRLRELLGDPASPVQLVFAGKAHPADAEGKAVLAEVVRRAQDRDARGRIVFLPGYDMNLAGALVQGVDVWLNTPRPPQEASGTSGMKAALNGALNLSVLDGWWAEAYSPEIGWAIPDELSAAGDEADEAGELLRILEEEVLPLYYDRDADGVPLGWAERMRESIATVGERFSASRMVAEYVERFYLPAHMAGAAVGQTAGGLGRRGLEEV